MHIVRVKSCIPFGIALSVGVIAIEVQDPVDGGSTFFQRLLGLTRVDQWAHESLLR